MTKDQHINRLKKALRELLDAQSNHERTMRVCYPFGQEAEKAQERLSQAEHEAEHLSKP